MKSKTKKIALTEIIILLVGVFAFVWLINGLPSISAEGKGPTSCTVSQGGKTIGTGTCIAKTSLSGCPSGDTEYTALGGTTITGCSAAEDCCISPTPNSQTQSQPSGGNGGTSGAVNTGATAVSAVAGGITAVKSLGTSAAPTTVLQTPPSSLQAAEWTQGIKDSFQTPSLSLGSTSSGSSLAGGPSGTITGTSQVGSLTPQTTTPSASGIFGAHSLFGSTLAYSIVGYATSAAAAVGGYFAMTGLARTVHANSFWTSTAGGIGAAGAGIGSLALFGLLTWTTFGVAAVAAVIAAIFTRTTKEQGAVVYYCNQWQPVPGGQNCDLCNHQTVPCSLYQCKSLGQSCAFSQSNASNGGASFCYYQNPHDINPPIMTPNTNALTPGFIYQNSTAASPPDREVKIIYTNDQAGCVPAFSTVTFGVNTNEYAACKISFNRTDSYGNMATYIGGSGLNLNHTQALKIPYINTSIGQSNVISAYVRCQDANGNADVGNFVFQMCVQKGPDLTPPVIDSTNILNNTALVSGVQNVSVNFNVNKPSYCRWSYDPGTEYDSMQNNMSCVNDTTQLNGVLDYTCAANLSLTSTTPGKKTYFYAKCRDMTPTQNTNTQDYVYALSSSQPLVIKSVSPNATTISNSGSTTPITITATTIGGVNNGNASCTYIDNNNPSAGGVPFANTPSYQSSTTVYDSTGAQSYNITCTDDAGNSDTKTINFNVNLDNTPPVVTRVYYNNGQMEITTNEQAMCEYMTGDNCDYYFGQGTNISSSNGGKIHEFPWNTATDLSVKCEDAYGNLPTAGTCSIVVRAYGNQSS